MKKPTSICIFGDSISWGAWDLEKAGWVNRLWVDIGVRDDDYVEIYNCSISGATSGIILKNFENEALIRSADALIFQVGSNDSAYEIQPGKPLVSVDNFKRNIEEVVKKAKRITNKVIFFDLKNCDESKTTPVSWVNLYYTNLNIQKYLRIVEEVCEENDILFTNIEIQNNDFYDGLHPNNSGHQKIFEYMKKILIENNWI